MYLMGCDNHVETLRPSRVARLVKRMQNKRKVRGGEFMRKRRNTGQGDLVRIKFRPRRKRRAILLQNSIACNIWTGKRVDIKANTERPAGRDSERWLSCPLESRVIIRQHKDRGKRRVVGFEL